MEKEEGNKQGVYEKNTESGVNEVLQIYSELNATIRSSDSKGNFFLVFLVALLGMLVALLPSVKAIQNEVALGAAYCLFIITALLALTSICLTLFAIIPKDHFSIDIEAMNEESKYNLEKYNYQRIITYTQTEKDLLSFINKKTKLIKLCVYFALASLLFFVCIMILLLLQ